MAPQIAGLLFVYFFWNPLDTGFKTWEKNKLWELLVIFYWHIRDLNRCEFYSALLMICGLATAWYHKKYWVYRAFTAMVVIGMLTTIFSTQLYKYTSVADVRFMAPLIPLVLLIETAAVNIICSGRIFAALIVATFAAFTNFGNGGIFMPEGVRSTAWMYANELLHPVNSDPFAPTAEWIRNNIPAGASVYVEPNANAYPLMFLAPKPIYAWQLENRNDPQFKNLDPVYFKGELAPDYLIAFGPHVETVRRELDKYAKPGVSYSHVHTVNAYFNAMYRPELFWRTFTPVGGYPEAAKIFVFKRNGIITPRIPKEP